MRTAAIPTAVSGERRRGEPPGILTISLDFELHWGVRDKVDLETYGSNILGARDAVPRILDLFAQYGIHATWATVGFLFFDDKDELLGHLPARRPSYLRRQLSPYAHIAGIGPNERRDPYHFARSLIMQIRACPGQEVGTHTFSHYYCLEQGQTLEEFRADLAAAHAAAQLLGVQLKSLVFPRNQWRADYLAACAESGIRTVRGNPRSRIYAADANGGVARLCRLLDAYVDVSGHHCGKASYDGDLADVPASRFLRPFTPRLAPLEGLRLRRIRAGMRHAAERGLVYHLWWHPHNFGAHQASNFAALHEILEVYRELAEEYGMSSRAMDEVLGGAPPVGDAAEAAAKPTCSGPCG